MDLSPDFATYNLQKPTQYTLQDREKHRATPKNIEVHKENTDLDSQSPPTPSLPYFQHSYSAQSKPFSYISFSLFFYFVTNQPQKGQTQAKVKSCNLE